MPTSAEARRSAVLNQPNLTRDFHRVTMDPARPEILRFANRYGLLTGGIWLAKRGQSGPRVVFRPGNDPADFSESLSMWREETIHFRHLYDLWQLLRVIQEPSSHTGYALDTARRNLGDRVRWSDDDAIGIASEIKTSEGSSRSWNWITHRALPEHDDIIANLPKGDLAAAARYHLMTQVAKKLKGGVHSYLLPFRTSTLRFVPDSLITAIYLRFAFEISEGIGRLRECAGCAQPFVPRRKDQRY